LFISHSSRDDDWAIALHDWLIREGWSGRDDIFLDLDPERGIAAGQRWAAALDDAATRCEAVLFIVTQAWLGSKWCGDEYQLASKYNKKLFALLAEDIALDRLPGGLTAQWQVVRLKGEPAERFLTVHPLLRHQSPVHIAEAGLRSLKRGLEKAGIGAETFDLQPDPASPFGWRGPYRGLEALEPEDAAVFFGRTADIVRGIDMLRGLAARAPPRVLVILGASGAGKSSFLRAGLWPRLARDDAQWLPLRTVRAARGGAIEGTEGLLSALEEVHRRFGRPASRAALRQRLAEPASFVALLRELREAAARRALISEPPFPLPLLCFDQAEEMFAADAGAEAERLMRLARAAAEGDQALLLATIRSDAYGLMQSASSLAGIDQVPLSLGPVPAGEIARIIREPGEVLRRKAGPAAPVFDPAVIEALQAEIKGESDALPLLAFVMQRLMGEHAAAGTIGPGELAQTGGVTAAIESEAEAALAEAGFAQDHTVRREVLRRLFIPRLARIDRESRAPQRRIARHRELPADLLGLVGELTRRRLLVVKVAVEVDGAGTTEMTTVEVAHEALLRHWPTLAELLAEDRDALLLLDGVLLAATDWEKAEATRKPDYLAHRGSRLTDAQALESRGPDWKASIAPAHAYLAACQAREDAEQQEKEATQARAARLHRRIQHMSALVGVLFLGIAAGVAWSNRVYLEARTLVLAETIWPKILTPEAERALKAGDRFKECADCPEMVVVPAGEFMMGSPKEEKGRFEDEGPPHRVAIPLPFAVGRFAVTFEEWDACVTLGGCTLALPDQGWGRGRRPVINVGWDFAHQYVTWLSERTGRLYRLLSEAEFEYAARGGTKTAYWWGDDIGKGNANCNGCDSEWDLKRTAPVGSFKPNPFGLYDVHGNTWTWVEDCYNAIYEGAPDDGMARIVGIDCSFHVVRGGAWYSLPPVLRAANRGRSYLRRLDALGLRVARNLLTR
jgi:formylglycine-generating enzyme required for sulfatase activity